MSQQSGQKSPNKGIAAELAAEQRSISIAEFFEQNKQMLGFDSRARAMVTAIKEAVDNALDAAEDAGILPEVSVTVTRKDEYYTIAIEDNGPGLPKENIPKVFGKLLYGSRFHSRVQTRGQQGIGISAAVLYAQQTTGRPARITSRTGEDTEAKYFEVRIDTDENDPEITTETTTDWDKEHGTRIEMDLDATMQSRKSLHEYIKNTAVVNPHAEIHFTEPEAEFHFERVVDTLPEEPEEILPHPHGMELGTLQNMLHATDSYSLSGFLQDEFTRVGRKTAENIIDGFRDAYYGRDFGWSITHVSQDEVTETIKDAVAGKRKEETDEFANVLSDEILNAEKVSWTSLNNITNESAEEIEETYDTRFGETVREKTINAIWPLLQDSRKSTVSQIVDEATTSRKDDTAVAELGNIIEEKLSNSEKVRFTRSELESIVDYASKDVEEEYNETFGDKSREKITDGLWSSMHTVNKDAPKVRDVADSREMANALLIGMSRTKVHAPPTKCLSPIGEDVITAGLKKEYNAEFYSASTRDAGSYKGSPFIVEAGLAYGGDLMADSSIELTRFANRVPLVYRRGSCAITQVTKSIGWNNYKLNQPGGNLPQGPVVLVVHVASTNVPFTSESKDAVASVPSIEDKIERAIRDVALDMKKYLKKQQSLEKRREKRDVVGQLLPVLAGKVANIAEREVPDIHMSRSRIMNSLLIEESRDDGRVTLSITNGTNNSLSPDLQIHCENKPTYPHPSDDIERSESDSGWIMDWSGSIESGGRMNIRFTVDGNVEVEVPNMEEEKVITITDN